MQSQVERSRRQVKRVGGARQVARHHTFEREFMLSDGYRKRERAEEHYKHILER